MKNITPFISVLMLAPAGAYAAPRSFIDISNIIIDIVNEIIPIFFALALIAFLWGVGKSILYADSADAKESGRTIMIYGIIALFIMTSLWGIIEIAQYSIFGY